MKSDSRINRSKCNVLDRRSLLKATTAAPVLLLLGLHSAEAQGSRPFSARIINSGHSLTDPIVPVLDAMVAAIGQQEARARDIAKSTIPGSPMEWRWEHRNEYGPDARYDIGNYDLLVITERVSLSNTVEWHNSASVASRWYAHAWKYGNNGKGAETILYATWVDIDSGPEFENPYNDPEGNLSFRERMPLEMERWQAIADQVNLERPDGSPPMRVIPGPLIMSAVYDAISEGRAPGLKHISNLFIDMIHPNYQGSYLISLAHVAVIYGVDPRSVPDGLGGIEVPQLDTANWMKQIVHDILRSYPPSGYTG